MSDERHSQIPHTHILGDSCQQRQLDSAASDAGPALPSAAVGEGLVQLSHLPQEAGEGGGRPSLPSPLHDTQREGKTSLFTLIPSGAACPHPHQQGQLFHTAQVR